MQEKIVLIDGHSILNRAFYGIPDLTNAQGIHTNAVYGFLNILMKILDEEKPEYLAVAFDLSAPTFRHKMYEEYKGTRKPMLQELRQQVPMMKEMLQAMGIPILQMEGYEADDLLGTIGSRSEEKGMDVAIVSGDRDLLQLASEKILIRIPKTKKTGTEIENYYARDVYEKYQVTPEEFIDVKALMGDSSDNIKGVPGIGEKTATNLMKTFHSIENAYEHIEEVTPKRAKEMLREHYDLALFSKKLVTIIRDAEIDFDYEKARVHNFFTNEAYQLCKQWELKNILNRFNFEDQEQKEWKKIQVIKELSDCEAVFEKLKQEEKVAFMYMGEKSMPLGLALAYGDGESVWIPFQGFLTWDYIEGKRADLEACQKLLFTYDLKKQLSFMKEKTKIFDVKLAAYLINPLKSEYPYDEICKDVTGEILPSKEDLLGKLTLEKAMDTEEEKAYAYIESFMNGIYISYEPLVETLKEMEMLNLYNDIELPLVLTLYAMEEEGIYVDKAALKEYADALYVRIKELETSIYEKAGEEFNINSPKQLGVILFEKMQLPNGKKTKTGYSTAADVLDKLAVEYPIVKEILEYRHLSKLKSTYGDGLANYIKEDGRIHTVFQQMVTATGRLSSSDPNLQNIPMKTELGRLIRKVFLPKEGYVFVDADYSQIELRILAHLSGDEHLIHAYQTASDIHAITASQVFDTPLDQVTSLQRRNAKAVNFGIVYGISSFGLSEDLSISKKEAEQYIKKYFATYPSIKAYLDSLVEDGKKTGFSKTMFGRRRPIPELSSSNFMQRAFGERIAMNTPIQGTAADIMKIAMNGIFKELTERNLKSKLILQIHDEVLVETAMDEVEIVKDIIERQMEQAASLSVKLEVDAHVGKDWYEAK